MAVSAVSRVSDWLALRSVADRRSAVDIQTKHLQQQQQTAAADARQSKQ